MTTPKLDEDQIAELIQGKLTGENPDSNTAIGLLLMRLLPVMKEIAANLKRIESAISEFDVSGTSVSDRLVKISSDLQSIDEALRQGDRQ